MDMLAKRHLNGVLLEGRWWLANSGIWITPPPSKKKKKEKKVGPPLTKLSESAHVKNQTKQTNKTTLYIVGECQPCPKTSTQPCQCGKTKSVRPCASPEWQCDRLCGKGLSCGNHICEQVCHKGSCGSCPRGGARVCPCGKTGIKN